MMHSSPTYRSDQDFPEYRINGHGHLLPYPEEFPAFMRKNKILWISDDRKFMCQDDWKRPITDPSFFLDEKLQWMEESNVDHEVIITLSQLYCNGMERDLAQDVCLFQNDFNASIQERHPTRFTSGFVVPVAHTDVALREIQRCDEELGLKLLCLPTHFKTLSGKWKSVVSDELGPIWEEINRRKLAVEIHPYDADKIVNLENTYWRFHLIWMCGLTADTYHLYTLEDYPSRYPDMRVCFAHGNQFGQVNIGRRRQGYLGRPDLFGGTVDPKSHLGHSNIYFDTLVHDPLSLKILKLRQGASQIIAGLDDPYPLGEMASVGDSYPGKTLDDAVEEGLLTLSDRRAAWYDNVLRWLAGSNTEEIQRRIHMDHQQRKELISHD